MIGHLKGVLLRRDPPLVVLDVGGMGFELEAPLSTFERLPAVGAAVGLHTHLAVREDALLLYGFATEAERAMFRQLLRVAGIGARLALAILSGVGVDELVALVQSGDVARLTRLPGIGRKTAERLLVELREPLARWAAAPAADSSGAAVRDAEAALVALGYRPQEVRAALRDVAPEGSGSEAVVRAALRRLLKS